MLLKYDSEEVYPIIDVDGQLKKVVPCESCGDTIYVSSDLSDDLIMTDIWVCDGCLNYGADEHDPEI